MWEEIYQDDISSVHLNDTKVIIQDFGQIIMTTFKKQKEAVRHAEKYALLLEMRNGFEI